ncbi:DUF11 domain-containing protein [Streptomyces dangxiongensis]|uniref:DUF11 domain-containing protein n=1 Tax=Streptomyces dangxiongensis TaxID=1442032 RepID=A0A3G2J7X3_9ACTN|nr:DUF11 domain-containing protein [Streptomyces dangxiongensis]AYN37771.1 DUF11 domain-containing protein [Streptomyces dangxiongensis]
MATQTSPATLTGTSPFPVTESFRNSSPDNPGWRILGSAVLNGCLQLTPNASTTAGTALFDQAFPSALGVAIDFDYEIERGASPGDGFSVYLIDGAATTQPGAVGGALGYSRIPGHQPGVTRGYVGIGFDHFGNYATGQAGSGGPGFTPDMVGIRGSGNLHDGFGWLTGAKLTRPLAARWTDGAHVQIVIANDRITVRLSSNADPNGTTVIDGFPLPTNGQAPRPATFKLGLSAGTGAATAAHRIRDLKVALPADMPLGVTGPAQAYAGTKVCYPITVRNDGPNDASDAVVEGALPAQLSKVTLKVETQGGAQAGKGTAAGTLRQPVNLPRGGSATITVCGTVDPKYTGQLTTTARITSPGRANTSARQSGQATTAILVPPPETGMRVWQEGGVDDAPGGGGTQLTVCATSREFGKTIDPGPITHVFTAPTGFRWNGFVAPNYTAADMSVRGDLPPVEPTVSADGRTLTFTYNPHVYTTDQDRDVITYACGLEAVPGATPGRYTDGEARIGAAPPARLKASVIDPDED